MSYNQHAEWLQLIEVSGPFLAEPILKEAFPQGLDEVDAIKRKQFRSTYEEWQEVTVDRDEEASFKAKIHQEWIHWVIQQGLEWDENQQAEDLKPLTQLESALSLTVAEHSTVVAPDFALFTEADGKQIPYLLFKSYPAGTSLHEPVAGDAWSASPAERMVQLCKHAKVRLAIITNGEQWMFIDAPEGGITTYASWYARLFSQEPVTLKAFFSLFNIRTIFSGFGNDATKLTALLDDSLKHQDDVTEALGEQVSRAVEVLVQSLDRINTSENGTLLEGVDPDQLYEAGLTLMMRLVFILCAEERDLLLMGNETYEAYYALSTLRLKLEQERGEHGEQVLSTRKNSWSRLLALFRAVYAGIEHDNMTMPALGGSLFDPDRFPFLEGRPKDSSWKLDAAQPLDIDNQTVLLFLNAIQIYKGRTLSYRALDVEQIGYVYEGLLEKNVVKATHDRLELNVTQKSKKPYLHVDELASAELDGETALYKLLVERTGKNKATLKKLQNKALSDQEADRLLIACQNDVTLKQRIEPYYHLLETDSWDNPLIYRKDSFMVTTGSDRRETGTHYTPKSLTESIVKETLEPVVYIGPAEGKPREEWQLKSPAELLDLKICDPAMGSGAFLVQVCRWLAERLCESWLQQEANGYFVTSEGNVVPSLEYEALTTDTDERLMTAKRLIAERCLYGADINALAVELAKLSIWLVTLSKGRPFGFLDHNLKHGDSLLGLHKLDQLYYLDMNPTKLSDGGGTAKQLFSQAVEDVVIEALSLRKEIRHRPIKDIHDIEVMENMEKKVQDLLRIPELAADALVGEVLSNKGKSPRESDLSIQIGEALKGDMSASVHLERVADKLLKIDLPVDRAARKPFHWCLEFPEVFDASGFDAIVGNPPFLGGQKITGAMGVCYRDYLVNTIAQGKRGSADLVAYFFIRANSILASEGCLGLIAVNTISEGNTREIGLDSVLETGATIFRAFPNVVWPGSANVVTSSVFIKNNEWKGIKFIDDKVVPFISSALTHRENWRPVKLKASSGVVFQGTIILGEGFLVEDELYEEWKINKDLSCNVVFEYLIGKEVNQSPTHKPSRNVINFFDWDEEQSSQFISAYDLISTLVKPERQRLNEKGEYALRKPLPQRWWQYGEKRPAMFHTLGRGHAFSNHPKNWDEDKKALNNVIVFATGATKYPCFTFVPNTYVYAHSLCVLASESYGVLACLSSDMHAVWAWEHGSRMKQDLRYTHGDVFETYPFPISALENQHEALNQIGRCFFELRAKYMIENNKGLTKTYNDLHNPECIGEEIEVLRKAQIKINDTILDAYEFDDIEPEYGFHKVGYLPESKNLRFTISETAREEVLYRLSMLNKERFELENERLVLPKTKQRKAVGNEASLQQNVLF